MTLERYLNKILIEIKDQYTRLNWKASNILVK